jgi:F-type H+-transporting ATPase subunit beta
VAASAQRAFRPALSIGLKASAARFASSNSAIHGKIHQVIGAVVDGKRKFFPTTTTSSGSNDT